jgi:hypothetical protein
MRLAVIAIVSAAVLGGCGGGGSSSTSASSDQAKAIAEAQAAFGRAQAKGVDLSTGPCIAETLPDLPAWAADVAHDPRQPIDDQPANQCASFRAGRTHHFVELTPDGTLIRAQ